MNNESSGRALKKLGGLLALGMLLSLCACQGKPVATERSSNDAATESPAATLPRAETQPVARYITEGTQVLSGGVDYTQILTDASAYSATSIPAGATVTLKSRTPFYGLYIIWNHPPGSYELLWEGGQAEGGAYGFLHEYVPLGQPVSSLQIRFLEEGDHGLCDFYFLTEGSPPPDVQLWQPPLEQADILVFPTHADDDVLFFGPVMVYYAVERGLKIQTAFMVDHNVFPIRGHERLNGLWTMGIRHYPVLGTAPDLESHDYLEAYYYYYSCNIEQWQVEQIRRFKPLVILGHDINGEYGNSGHMINTHYLMRAVESAADPALFPELTARYGAWDTPKLYLHLYPENELIFDVNRVLRQDALGRTPFEIATEAMSCHKTQQELGYRVSQDELQSYDCRRFGLYRTLVGDDTAADIMENIDYKEWRD